MRLILVGLDGFGASRSFPRKAIWRWELAQFVFSCRPWWCLILLLALTFTVLLAADSATLANGLAGAGAGAGADDEDEDEDDDGVGTGDVGDADADGDCADDENGAGGTEKGRGGPDKAWA